MADRDGRDDKRLRQPHQTLQVRTDRQLENMLLIHVGCDDQHGIGLSKVVVRASITGQVEFRRNVIANQFGFALEAWRPLEYRKSQHRRNKLGASDIHFGIIDVRKRWVLKSFGLPCMDELL